MNVAQMLHIQNEMRRNERELSIVERVKRALNEDSVMVYHGGRLHTARAILHPDGEHFVVLTSADQGAVWRNGGWNYLRSFRVGVCKSADLQDGKEPILHNNCTLVLLRVARMFNDEIVEVVDGYTDVFHNGQWVNALPQKEHVADTYTMKVSDDLQRFLEQHIAQEVAV